MRSRQLGQRWLSSSSSRWMQRHKRDPFVRQSVAEQTRSRSAYKLQQIDQKHALFKGAGVVVDLGAAPGGWSLYIAKHAKAHTIVAVDMLEMEPIPGVQFLQADFTKQDTQTELRRMTGEQQVSVVVSDMAPNFSGNGQADHLRSIDLAVQAFEFSAAVLLNGGTFLCKYFQGNDENSLILPAKETFKTIRRLKPEASRKESSEMYLLCTGFQNRHGPIH